MQPRTQFCQGIRSRQPTSNKLSRSEWYYLDSGNITVEYSSAISSVSNDAPGTQFVVQFFFSDFNVVTWRQYVNQDVFTFLGLVAGVLASARTIGVLVFAFIDWSHKKITGKKAISEKDKEGSSDEEINESQKRLLVN
jgi:hypothetical protein